MKERLNISHVILETYEQLLFLSLFNAMVKPPTFFRASAKLFRGIVMVLQEGQLEVGISSKL